MHQSHYGPSLKLPIANCNWLRRDDQSIVRSLHRCLLFCPPLRLPCSALGHVLQTFCCRLLKVISLLRAAFPSLSPLLRLHLVSLAPRRCIFFARLHVLQEGCRTPSLLGGPEGSGEGRGLYLLQHLWLFVCHIICTNCNLEK